MEKKYRTFVAVKINPEPELLYLFDECREILSGEAIKWVEENNLHLTLKFFGETTESQVNKIKEILEAAGGHFGPFSFMLEGLGYFKSKGQPSVIFVAIKDFSAMEQLVHEIQNKLEELNFEKESKAFKPHLTLGRIKFLKDHERFYNCLGKYKTRSIQKVNIEEIILYQSILKPQGPVYIPLKIVKLNSKL